VRRTTENLVKALQARGIDTEYHHTGGGIFCGYVALANGSTVFFTDDVLPDAYENADWVPFFRNYDGGFEVVVTQTDEVLFAGTIGGCKNLGLIGSAEQMAEEYVRIIGYLDPTAVPQRESLPRDMMTALEEFHTVGDKLLAVWEEHSRQGELNWLTADNGRYPKYLPSFDEFLFDFYARMRGDTAI
jgi:hypothetical protein